MLQHAFSLLVYTTFSSLIMFYKLKFLNHRIRKSQTMHILIQFTLTQTESDILYGASALTATS